jgi:hypothetical protein
MTSRNMLVTKIQYKYVNTIEVYLMFLDTLYALRDFLTHSIEIANDRVTVFPWPGESLLTDTVWWFVVLSQNLKQYQEFVTISLNL